MSKYDKTNMSEETVLTPEEQRNQRFGKVQLRLLVIAVLLLVSVIILSIRPAESEQPIVLAPDYPQVEKEPNAFPSNDDQEKMEAEANGGAVAIIYSDQVTYDRDTDTVTMMYTNPSSSTASVVVQIILFGPDGAEYLLAQSGAMEPGYCVTTLDADLDSNVVLSEGGYTGAMRLLFYNTVTGEKAIVNTEIEVTVTVK